MNIKHKVMRAILFVNPKKGNAGKFAEEISKELNTLNIASDVYSFGGKSIFSPKKGYGVAISLGGDGTVLSAARAMSPLEIPVFPVNFGSFGFIAGVSPLEWREVFEGWLNGKAPLSRRLMLEITVERDGREVFLGSCLNDVLVSSYGIKKIINLRVSCSETELETVLELGSYRSDGLIVSTPTGSTAYSAAAGGPIVDPELQAMILNPICPFILTHRPIVLSADETVIVEVEEKQQSGVLLTLDGQVTEKLNRGDRIYVKKAPHSCVLITSGREGFYKALRTKLSWAGEARPELAKLKKEGAMTEHREGRP